MRTLARRSFGPIAAFLLLLVFVLNAQDQKQTDSPETVSVRVSIRDPLNSVISRGLTKDNFKIYEDKIEQTIDSSKQQADPISLGIVLDISSSMKHDNNLNKISAAISRLLRRKNAEDEYFVITFSETAQIQPIPNNVLPPEALVNKKGGDTALFDAVYLGLEQLKQSKRDRKALIIIANGEDNSSRHKPIEIRKLASESDTQINAILKQGMMGSNEIMEIVSLTGGSFFAPYNFSETEYYVDLIYRALQNQYIISYSPTNRNHDGKWRKITVKLNPPPDYPKVIISAREGRYAPKK
jgi:Ca-activated chloride channel homolog